MHGFIGSDIHPNVVLGMLKTRYVVERQEWGIARNKPMVVAFRKARSCFISMFTNFPQ